MFSKSFSTIGNFEVLEINSQDNNHKLSLIPERGLLVSDLKLNNIHVIDGVETEKDIVDNPFYQSSLLAPFPNRIKDGTYKYKDHTYQLAINEEPRKNALHGFIYKRPFELKDEHYDDDAATLTFSHNYNGEIDGYPFPFYTEIVMKLSASAGLEVTMNFKNTSEHTIPFGFGWHPYFKLKGNVDELSIQFPPVKYFEVDERMIPTGKIKDFNTFNELQKIGEADLDNCFKLDTDAEIVKTIIKDPEGNTLQLWQETGENKFNFLQCFIPPHRKSIAVEPVTSCINAFNNGIGLLELEKGKNASARVGISVN